MIRPVSDGRSMRVIVSTKTTRVPKNRRPTSAKGTTGPAPVLRMTVGRSRARITTASHRFLSTRQSRSACVMKNVFPCMSGGSSALSFST